MAVYEYPVLLMGTDGNGNRRLLYPITQLSCVDGAEALLNFDEEQKLTDPQKAQALRNIGAIAAPVTAKPGQFLKITSVDENGFITGVEAVDPSEVSNLADVAISGDYNDLLNKPEIREQVQSDWEQTDATRPDYIQNKPFGTTPDLYGNSQVPFYNNYGGNASIYIAQLGDNFITLENGDIIRVVWDGKEYECTARQAQVADFMSYAAFIGNNAITKEYYNSTFEAEDTGEPFAIVAGLGWIYTRSTDATHSIQIQAEDNVIKIDKKYLPEGILTEQTQADWAETDEESSGFIKNKPTITTYTHPQTHPASMITGLAPVATNGKYASLFEKPFGDAPRLEEGTLVFSKMGGDLNCYYHTLSERLEFVKGETFTIQWDGVTYTCVCKDFADQDAISITDVLYLGNLTKFFGLGLGEDTDEPFIICISATSNIDDYGSVVIHTTETTETHTISIIPTENVRKLDIKYLPDEAATKDFVKEAIAGIEVSGGSAVTETDILPETEMVLTPVDIETPAFAYTVESTLGLEKIEVGKEYQVVWDGVEYSCVAGSLADVADWPEEITFNSQVWLGNPAIADGEEDSGEPFFIMAVDGTATDDTGSTIEVKQATFATNPGITAESITCKVRIYQKADLKVSWENVTDKPFYDGTEETELLPETSMAFTYDPEVDTTAYRVESEPSDDMLTQWLSDWDNAEVMWDGTKYVLEPSYIQGVKCIGNTNAMIGIGDNGVPFIMALITAEMNNGTAMACIYAMYDSKEGTTTESTGADGNVVTTTTYPTINHTVGVTLCSTETYKLPDRFQHQADWDETDKNSATFIENKPFGTIIPDGTVIMDATPFFDEWLWLINPATGQKFLDTSLLKPGVKYYAEVAGVSMTGEYMTADELVKLDEELASLFEQASFSGGIILYKNDVAVADLLIDIGGMYDWLMISNAGFALYPTGENGESYFVTNEEYPVKITVMDGAKKIDQKYIPDPPEFDLTAMGLPALPLDGTTVRVECDTSELYAALGKGVVKVSFTANVGTEQTVSGIVNAMYMLGTYQCSFLGIFGAPMLLNFNVTTTAIDGCIKTLATT